MLFSIIFQKFIFNYFFEFVIKRLFSVKSIFNLSQDHKKRNDIELKI